MDGPIPQNHQATPDRGGRETCPNPVARPVHTRLSDLAVQILRALRPTDCNDLDRRKLRRVLSKCLERWRRKIVPPIFFVTSAPRLLRAISARNPHPALRATLSHRERVIIGVGSSNQSGEGEIRKPLIEADLVDCMVALPGQLFYSMQIARDKRAQPSPGASRHPLPPGERVIIGVGSSNQSGEGEIRKRLIENRPGGLHGRLARPALLFGADCAPQARATLTRRFAPPSPTGRGSVSGWAGVLRASGTGSKDGETGHTGKAFAWELFRDRRFLGLKFRRQHRIGSHIVDSYCHENSN